MSISFYLSDSQGFTPEDYVQPDIKHQVSNDRLWEAPHNKDTDQATPNLVCENSVVCNALGKQIASSSSGSSSNHRSSNLLVKANGRNVIISDEARKRSADIFTKIMEPTPIPLSSAKNAPPPAPSSILKNAATSSNSRVSSLLQKANGAHVIISESAAQKGAKWLNKESSNAPSIISANTSHIVPHGVAASNPSGRTSSLLQKANGGSVYISESLRKKAVTFLDSVNSESTNAAMQQIPSRTNVPITPLSAQQGNHQSRTSTLLTTASGSKVVISEAARLRASQFMASGNVNIVTPLISEQLPSSTNSVKSSMSSASNHRALLQKANGATILISEEARQRASKWISGEANIKTGIQSAAYSSVHPVVLENNITAPYDPQIGFNETPYLNTSSAGVFTVYDAFSQLCESSYLGSPSLHSSHDLKSAPDFHETPFVGIMVDKRNDDSSSNLIQRTLFNDDAPPESLSEIAVNANNKDDDRLVGSERIDSAAQDISAMEVVPHNDQQPLDESFQFNFSPSCKLKQFGLITPCLDRDSLLKDPIWPEEVASWDEIFNRVYAKKDLFIDYSKELSAVTSTQVLTPIMQMTGKSVKVSMERSDDRGHLLACQASDKETDPSLSNCFVEMILLLNKEFPEMSRRWAVMQLNWIVWTLISHQRRQPSLYPQGICTLYNIEECLRRRIELYYFKKAIDLKDCTPPAFATVKPASQHFLKSGTMSPLHRCCEIISLVWPLCVCVSITSQMNNSDGKQIFIVQITDGWYWARAIIDKDIENLIRRGKLQDGYKIIVFTAPITAGDSLQCGGTVKLHGNSVRLAHAGAPLGFVNPRHLSRGLSLKSILPDGGSVFGIRFETVALSTPYSRVKLVDQEGELLIDGITVTMSEVNWIKGKLEDLQEKALTKMLSQETKRRKYSDEGDHEFNKFGANKFQSLFQLEVSSFQDILVKCELSGSLAWIKTFTTIGDESDIFDGAFRFALGQKYLLTNVKPNKSASSTLTLSTTNQSSLTCLTKTRISNITPQKSSGGQSSSKIQNAMVSHNKMQLFDSLASVFRCRSLLNGETNDASTFAGSDLSCKLIVVDWFEDGPLAYSVSSALDTEWCSVTNLRVLCIDESNYTVEILYPTFKKYLEKLSWLKKNKEINAEHLLVRAVDCQYQIVRAVKTDRTSMTLVTHPSAYTVNRTIASLASNSSSHISSAVDILSQSLSQSQSTQSNAANSAKKKKFSTPRSTKRPVVTPISSHHQVSLLAYTATTSSLSTTLQILCEEECKRFAALRNSQAFYTSHRWPTLEVSTIKTTCVGYLERYPIVDLSSHFPDCRTVIVHTNQEVVIALCEAQDVEVMVPSGMSTERANPIEGTITMQQISEAIELLDSEHNQCMMITRVVVHVSPNIVSVE